MNSVYNIFLTTLVCLLLQFHDNVTIEARTIASNSGIFSIELIRRSSPFFNSSLTPRKHSRNSVLGSVSHGHKIRLSSEFYASNGIQTDIIPNGGDYLMKFALGTPPVEFTAVADTGSDLVWLQCTPCQQCFPQQSSRFDPTKSSTNQIIPCNSQKCYLDDIPSGCVDNSCTYRAEYGDGTRSIGTLSTDTISFSATTTFPSFIYGCGHNQLGNVGNDGDGIVGLGGGELSLVSQLKSIINNKFSYCLTPLSSAVNGKLSLGADVTTPGAVSTPYTTKETPTFYYLTLDSITIQNGSVAVANDVVIDSGTTLTYLPSSVYDSVRTALKAAIQNSPVDDPNKLFDPCYEAQQGFSAPDVVFNFKGADVVLKTANSFITLGSQTCFAMVPADDVFIFGNIAQSNFQVGYDLQAQTVSFAPADCTK